MLLSEQKAIIERHQIAAPVKVSPLARELGIPVYGMDDRPGDMSGMLKRLPETASGYAIYVNGRHHPRRKRFTIAHEIGHFILHPI